MMLLFIEAAKIDDAQRESIRENVCAQLAKSWRSERVDRAFMQIVCEGASPELAARFDTADRLAPLMVSAARSLAIRASSNASLMPFQPGWRSRALMMSASMKRSWPRCC